VAAVVMLVAGPGAAPALADFRVLGSVPAAGAVLATPPDEVRITFDQPVSDEASLIQVRKVGGGSGAAASYADLYNAGLVRAAGSSALVQSVRLLPPATYEVAWTAGAGPGTPTTSGRFRFTVAGSPEGRAGAGQWVIIGLMALVIALLGVSLARRRIGRRATLTPAELDERRGLLLPRRRRVPRAADRSGRPDESGRSRPG
jgi:methionine-rich copper-binding protein CopC